MRLPVLRKIDHRCFCDAAVAVTARYCARNRDRQQMIVANVENRQNPLAIILGTFI